MLSLPKHFFLVLCIAATSTFAQQAVYRCGNEYTNNPSAAKQANCRKIQNSPLTVVHTGGGRAQSAAPQPQAQSTQQTQRQAQRDTEARAILEHELDLAQQNLQNLERLSSLASAQEDAASFEQTAAQITRQLSDIASIKRELGRLPSPQQ